MRGTYLGLPPGHAFVIDSPRYCPCTDRIKKEYFANQPYLVACPDKPCDRLYANASMCFATTHNLIGLRVSANKTEDDPA
eukprot:gene687-55337_t